MRAQNDTRVGPRGEELMGAPRLADRRTGGCPTEDAPKEVTAPDGPAARSCRQEFLLALWRALSVWHT
jgi:hypothetical protein